MNKLYQQSIFELPAHNYSRNRIIWSNINTHNVILQAAAKFGINYGITLIEPCEDGCEFYFLGTTSNDNSVINNYLSNFQLVEKFVANFKDSGKSILALAEKERVCVDDWLCNDLNFSIAHQVDKYSFLAAIYGYRFTSRELQCLPLLLNGFSSKQIAEYLNLSFRTVEDYINNIKQKCNTKTKNELLKLLSDQFN
jgi:DNA-binding CsgD family transcriptional regulator